MQALLWMCRRLPLSITVVRSRLAVVPSKQGWETVTLL